jgi:hypothetical protein
MDTAADIWHFSRTQDADRLVETLRIGLVSAVAIIEPRRKGKTTFLIEDLAPAALKNDYLPIYINLAASAGNLEALIASAIGYAIEQRAGLGAKIRKAAGLPVKKISAKAKLADAEVGGEVEPNKERASSPILIAAFDELVRLKKNALFLLDEVHRLAEAHQQELAWSLRSLLDTHRKTVKVVATSSSAASYEVLVTGEKRAFNRWFTRIPLTPLGKEFPQHLAAVVKKHYPRHTINQKDIIEAFETLGRSPKFIRDYLNARILAPSLEHGRALDAAKLEAAKDSAFTDEFMRLSPLQKAVLVGLGSGNKELFSEQALKEFAIAIKAEEVSKSVIQRAVKSLADKGWLIRHDRGEYKIADSLFEQWLTDQLRTGALPGPSNE